jgi:Uma2 family endonuclease
MRSDLYGASSEYILVVMVKGCSVGRATGTEGKSAMSTKAKATIEDLYDVPENGKAEIVEGEVVFMSPTQRGPNRAAGKIYASLDLYEQEQQNGYAFTDNMAFIVDTEPQKSFSPDAAYFLGEPDGDLNEFIYGAPTFAVEVRSDGDYGAAAERKMARKRDAYFQAGTLVVWDVDVLRERVIRVYRPSDVENPTVYASGDMAEAEPAVPGWSIAVDKVMLRPSRK